MPEHSASDDWRKNMEETVREIRKDLYVGNGKPGMTYRMASVEKDVSAIQEREDRRSKKQDRIEVAVWVGVILTILNLLVAHLK